MEVSVKPENKHQRRKYHSNCLTASKYQHIFLFGKIETSKTGDQLLNETSNHSEFFLVQQIHVGNYVYLGKSPTTYKCSLMLSKANQWPII